METVAHSFLPDLLSRFSKVYPRITGQLHSNITPFLRDELPKGRLNCVLACEEITEGYVENLRPADWPMRSVAAPSLVLPPGKLAFQAVACKPGAHRRLTKTLRK